MLGSYDVDESREVKCNSNGVFDIDDIKNTRCVPTTCDQAVPLISNGKCV